ncbi:MAG: type II toxin-antitoxin system HicA family toxin [Chitinispirillaceae bacterium]
MKAVSGKHFAKLLVQKGWKLCRIKGSHHVFCKENRSEIITLPIHGNATLKIGLQKYLMKIAGIAESEL